jgi:predicted RNA binding protein YcfA (HicA-like mRNA interferase family)
MRRWRAAKSSSPLPVPKPRTADDVFRALRAHDPRFAVVVRRAKGSHRLVVHPLGSFPVPYHKGRTLGKGLLAALIRRFSLPKDIFG